MERKGNPGKRYSKSFKNEVVTMYIESDESLRTLSANLGIPNPTIWRWIANFAEENPADTRLMDKIMTKSTNYGPKKPSDGVEEDSPKQVVVSQPRTTDGTPSLSAEEELRLLKIQLQKERLRADAYEEMINVAESKFNINIRKKAGAKQ